MICIRLERLFELLIIPAPKRNSKLHCEMWTNPFCRASFWARGLECATLHDRKTRVRLQEAWGQTEEAWEARGRKPRVSIPAIVPIGSAFAPQSHQVIVPEVPTSSARRELRGSAQSGRSVRHTIQDLLLAGLEEAPLPLQREVVKDDDHRAFD
jgi:hypothetical protein